MLYTQGSIDELHRINKVLKWWEVFSRAGRNTTLLPSTFGSSQFTERFARACTARR